MGAVKMKKFLALTIIISILISVFPAAGYATGNSVEGLYKDGMEYYEKRDYDSAIARFRVAGEARGYAPAQNMLGICYRDGLGTEQNLSEAERQLLTAERNAQLYFTVMRTNELRITFMKNLVDTGYVFLGIYRTNPTLSDSTHVVWERIADECDLNNLTYLQQLRH